MKKQKKQQAKWPLGELMEVEWNDAAGGSGWADLQSHRQEVGILPCRSIGYVLKNDGSQIVLVQSMAQANESISGHIAIPKRPIVRSKRVKGL